MGEGLRLGAGKALSLGLVGWDLLISVLFSTMEKPWGVRTSSITLPPRINIYIQSWVPNFTAYKMPITPPPVLTAG